MKRKRVLITGVAGFIGSAVARRLLLTGHEVYGIDNLLTGKLTNVPKGCEFLESGAESDEARDWLKKVRPSIVLHIGGQSSGEIGEEDPRGDCTCNVLSTVNLLAAAGTSGVSGFYFASSMGVYGNALGTDNSFVLNESEAGNPISVYGAGKWASECYLKTFAGRNLDCVALRMFNVYGPGQNMENLKQGMVSIFAQQALTSETIVVRGGLNRIRDFVYIDDVVSAWELLVNSERKPGFLAMNLGSGVGSSVEQLLFALQGKLGPKSIQVQGSTPADQSATVADIQSIREVLNWKPTFDLATGMGRFCDWLIQELKLKSGLT